jgi:hypothetical protein
MDLWKWNSVRQPPNGRQIKNERRKCREQTKRQTQGRRSGSEQNFGLFNAVQCAPSCKGYLAAGKNQIRQPMIDGFKREFFPSQKPPGFCDHLTGAVEPQPALGISAGSVA